MHRPESNLRTLATCGLPPVGCILACVELKSSGGVVYSVQSTLPEAGGQVGVVPEAVSWEWLPGAPCGGDCCCEGRPA